MRRRQARLVAVLAALFVLQGPLCALACLDGSALTAAVAADASPAPAAGHGCHEAGSSSPSSLPSPPQSESPATHDDCECADAAPTLVSSSADAAAKLLTAAVAPPVRVEGPPVFRRLDRDTAIAAATDLPPPDLLLLHSILLI